MKILQIKKSAEFRTISQKGKKFHTKTITLLSSPTPEIYLQDKLTQKNAKNFCRVGYTASKAVGNAVVRNKVKRQLREIFPKLAMVYSKNHFDYVVIARQEISKVDFEKISTDLEFCLSRIHRAKSS